MPQLPRSDPSGPSRRPAMRAVTRQGLVLLPGLSDHDASLVGRHDNAVKHYLDTGDDGGLEEFEGVSVAGYELETSLDALDFYALVNDIRFEDIYEVN